MDPPDNASSAAGGYVRPAGLAEALKVLAASPHLILAGGTDVFPAHVGRPVGRGVVDVSGLAEIRGLAETGTHWRIGGGTTWTAIDRAHLPEAFLALKQAAREVGSIQIQNRGTIAGNLCNASPAADGIPPLLVLDAEVELVSAGGKRSLSLPEFLLGYRKTAIRPGELLSAVLIPKTSCGGQSAFVKLGARRYLVISIVMVAARLARAADGSISQAAVAVGAASPVAIRLRELERELAGLPRGKRPSDIVKPHHMAELSPIDDVRAPAGYRNDAALQAVREALDKADAP